jgi:hypothetical protein
MGNHSPTDDGLGMLGITRSSDSSPVEVIGRKEATGQMKWPNQCATNISHMGDAHNCPAAALCIEVGYQELPNDYGDSSLCVV